MIYNNLVSGRKLGMRNQNQKIAGILVIVIVFVLAACGTAGPGASTTEKPAIVSTIEGSPFKHIVLTEQAAARLNIQTAPVRNQDVNGVQQMVIPYGAVIYDLKGDTWVFASPEERTFIREAVTIDHIDGDMVILKDGPAVGTEVATVAVAELYGIDTGVGK